MTPINNRLYFAHSVKDYNSPKESNQLSQIRSKWQHYTIVNPRDIIIPDIDRAKLTGTLTSYISMLEKYLFKAIDTCSLLVAFDTDLTDGVQREIAHAVSNKIKVYLFQSPDNSIAERKNFYTKSSAYKFIEDYCQPQEGNICIASHPRAYSILNRKMILSKNSFLVNLYPHQYDYFKEYHRLKTLRQEDLMNYPCNHAFVNIFNDKVINWHNSYSKNDAFDLILENNIVGTNMILELDAPDDISGKRLNFFNYVSEFNKAINTISSILDDNGEEFNLMFSGNGIYIILSGAYGTNLRRYKDHIEDMIIHLHKSGLGEKTSVHLCNTETIVWNKYFKLPFTFHESKPRMSIPLPRTELDANWIDEHSDTNAMLNNYSLVDETIKEANWSKIW